MIYTTKEMIEAIMKSKSNFNIQIYENELLKTIFENNSKISVKEFITINEVINDRIKNLLRKKKINKLLNGKDQDLRDSL